MPPRFPLRKHTMTISLSPLILLDLAGHLLFLFSGTADHLQLQSELIDLSSVNF